nr:hypothetical protein GCM10020092_071010 [Actinoplanes digitatis]
MAWTGDPHERIDLVFDGLDTVAAVELGGDALGATRNMHRGYRYDVTALNDGVARPLTVRFTSAYTEAEQVRDLLGARANAYPEPFNFIRKMACGFGWDWGPTLVTARHLAPGPPGGLERRPAGLRPSPGDLVRRRGPPGPDGRGRAPARHAPDRAGSPGRTRGGARRTAARRLPVGDRHDRRRRTAVGPDRLRRAHPVRPHRRTVRR